MLFIFKQLKCRNNAHPVCPLNCPGAQKKNLPIIMKKQLHIKIMQNNETKRSLQETRSVIINE